MAKGPSNRNKHRYEVLSLIQEDNQQKLSSIAQKVGIGEPQVGRIIKAAREDGVITAHKAIINPLKLGLTSVGFVRFRLKDSNQNARDETTQHIQRWSNIQEIHHIEGEFDLFVKARFSVNATKMKFLDYVASQGNIADTESISVIDTVLETLDIAVDGGI